MSLLIILTSLQFLTGIYFYHINSLREERGFFLRFMMGIIIFVFFNHFLTSIFTGTDQQFIYSSVSLCVASVSSLYIRNNSIEQHTSPYLLLIALFPFVLFYVYYFLNLIFSEQLLRGEIFHLLDFFYHNFQTFLLMGSIAYDLFILKPLSSKIRMLSNSLDGCLALALFISKFCMLIVSLGSGLVYHFGYFFKIPNSLYLSLVFLLIFYFRFSFKIKALILQVRYAHDIHKALEMKSVNEKLEKEKFIFQQIQQYFCHKLDYLDQEFNLHTFASRTKLSKKEIETIIRKEENCSFAEFLKRKRIQYCMDHIEDFIGIEETIYTLASDLGFKSLSSFIHAFKKEVGCSPYIYLHNKRQDLVELKGN